MHGQGEKGKRGAGRQARTAGTRAARSEQISPESNSRCLFCLAMGPLSLLLWQTRAETSAKTYQRSGHELTCTPQDSVARAAHMRSECSPVLPSIRPATGSGEHAPRSSRGARARSGSRDLSDEVANLATKVVSGATSGEALGKPGCWSECRPRQNRSVYSPTAASSVVWSSRMSPADCSDAIAVVTAWLSNPLRFAQSCVFHQLADQYIPTKDRGPSGGAQPRRRQQLLTHSHRDRVKNSCPPSPTPTPPTRTPAPVRDFATLLWRLPVTAKTDIEIIESWIIESFNSPSNFIFDVRMWRFFLRFFYGVEYPSL